MHAICDTPNAAHAQHCIACQGQRRFEDCTMLNDHDFLKQHCICFCQTVRCDQADLSQQRGEQVNFMGQRAYFDDTDSEENDRDFLHGRR